MKTSVVLCLYLLLTSCKTSNDKEATSGEKMIRAGRILFCANESPGCPYPSSIDCFHDSLFVVSEDSVNIFVYDIKKSLAGSIALKQGTKGKQIVVTEAAIFLSEGNRIHQYSHAGDLLETVNLPFIGYCFYFFISQENYLLAFGNGKLLIYDKHRKLVMERSLPLVSDERFTNDGSRVFYNGHPLTSFRYSGDSLEVKTYPSLPAPLSNGDYCLSSHFEGKSVWYNYFERDALVLLNNSFTEVVKKISIGKKLKPGKPEIVKESGYPNLWIFPAKSEIIFARSDTAYVDIYKMKL